MLSASSFIPVYHYGMLELMRTTGLLASAEICVTGAKRWLMLWMMLRKHSKIAYDKLKTQMSLEKQQ
jgi:hypothetical protein